MGIVNNPSEKEPMKNGDDQSSINGEEGDLTIQFNRIVQVTNLRTGKRFPTGVSITDRFKPWEGNLYELKEL